MDISIVGLGYKDRLVHDYNYEMISLGLMLDIEITGLGIRLCKVGDDI